MKYISLILSGLALISSTAVFAATSAITAIEVSSEAQTVAPNAVSGKITVSLKNASGETEKIDESSNKLSLKSSSGTGEFSSNADKWEKTNELIVNKNTASRGFYYKDSTEGTHTLSFVLTSGETGKEWSTTHQITIGSGGSASSTGDTSATTTATTTPTNNVSISSGGSSLSSHESTATLFTTIIEPPFSVSAGRERLGNTGAPLIFHAVSTTKETGSVSYRWSFGDGSGGTGALVTHQYQLPGVYTVVLMGTRRTDEAASRTNVRITVPDISVVRPLRISDGTLGVVVRNNADYECNIGRFALRVGSSTETLAPDTIIPPHTEVPLITRIPYQTDVPIFVTMPNGSALSSKIQRDTPSLQVLSVLLTRLPRKYTNPIVADVAIPPSPPTVLASTTPLSPPRAVGENQRAGLIAVPKSEEGFLEGLWKRLRGK